MVDQLDRYGGYRHIVVFAFYREVTAMAFHEAIRDLERLGSERNVGTFRVRESVDLRKGRVVLFDAWFLDQEQFGRFTRSTLHGEVVERLRLIADWWVCDYFE
ncbi:hypothetical protein [Rarobacter incanus]|uniref:hypothetical protein n=1 Tax=Rarobacter incanus TaxID=153494 RepID=UPI0011542C80|nr:hypothetical protein [Rarobacter incanus]